MACKLNQIIAVTAGKKSQSQKALTEIHHQLQKANFLEGIARTYKSKDEEGERFPAEHKHVQLKVKDAVDKISEHLIELFDAVATQDWGNCIAKADVKVDSVVVVQQAPVTYLLFLEKQLVDIHTFIEKLPTLDPAETWKYNQDVDCYQSEAYETVKTKKVLKNHVKYEATKEHPAQVETYSEDIIVGFWTTLKFNGSLPAKEKNMLLDRVRKLQEAVKCAREEANSVEIQVKKIGADVFTYIFGK